MHFLRAGPLDTGETPAIRRKAILAFLKKASLYTSQQRRFTFLTPVILITSTFPFSAFISILPFSSVGYGIHCPSASLCVPPAPSSSLPSFLFTCYASFPLPLTSPPPSPSSSSSFPFLFLSLLEQCNARVCLPHHCAAQ